jgi:hypothetical protein
MDDSTVRRWMRHDKEAPAEIDDWLTRWAAFAENNPPP